MSEYEDMTLEELQALKKDREKKALLEELIAEDEAGKIIEQEEYKAKVIEEYLNSQAQPDPKITTDVQTSKNDPEPKHIKYWNSLDTSKYVPYEDLMKLDDTFDFTDSDTGCDTDVSDWSPADVYLSQVWMGLYCEANLFKIAVKGININAGDGMGVQIRTIGKFGSPTEAASCECVSCASVSLSSYSLTLKQYGLVTEICEYDIWDAGDIYRKKHIEAFGRTWGEWFDAQIYAELESASPGYSESVVTTGACDPELESTCCSDLRLLGLYEATNDIIAQMREASYNPDYIILSPSVARMFKGFSTPQPVFVREATFSEDGRLTKLAGINVIESCVANSCVSTSAEVQIIIIDSSRAVGAAFGKKPTLESDRNIDCNSTTYAMWCFAAFGELDTGAIGHVVNVTFP